MLRPKRGRVASVRGDGVPDAAVRSESSNVPANSETVQESPSHLRSLTMTQHSHNLLVFLNEDRTRQKFCDVSVLVGGKVYRAHKAVLAHGSSYFHAELSKSPATTTHVTLDHVEDSVFQHLLGFLYTAECIVSETELPALAEAARFLDMMDILKLLCEDGGPSPVQAEKREAEGPTSDAAGAEAESQSPCGAEYNLVTTNLSLQNSSAESTDVQEEVSAEEGKMVTSQRGTVTRRSARRRRTPTKYKRDDLKCTQEERTPSPQDKNQNKQATADENETSRPAQGGDVTEEDGEEDERGDTSTAQNKTVQASGAGGSPAKEGSLPEMTEREPEVQAPAAGGSNQSPVYPEGLAPVIIHTSCKKTLKCPKCEKTFDRAGEAHVGMSWVELESSGTFDVHLWLIETWFQMAATINSP